MKKMSKVLAIVMCLALVVTAFAACSNGNQGGDSQTQGNTPSGDSSNTGNKPAYYKCAYLGPMTGESAQYGEVHTRAYQFAIDQINEAGGINGVPIKMDIYDDKNDAKDQTVSTPIMAEVMMATK